jgi:hypothetical protein
VSQGNPQSGIRVDVGDGCTGVEIDGVRVRQTKDWPIVQHLHCRHL